MQYTVGGNAVDDGSFGNGCAGGCAKRLLGGQHDLLLGQICQHKTVGAQLCLEKAFPKPFVLNVAVVVGGSAPNGGGNGSGEPFAAAHFNLGNLTGAAVKGVADLACGNGQEGFVLVNAQGRGLVCLYLYLAFL